MKKRPRQNWNDETTVMPAFSQNESTNYQQLAMDMVEKVVCDDDTTPRVYFELYVVWFCKTLQNWKALVCTTLPDNKYYEVTHNGDLRETYVDTYTKTDNRTIFDKAA